MAQIQSDAVAEALQRPLAVGEAVRAYYHMNDHPHGYRYVRMIDGAPEETPEGVGAAVGLSSGWIPATVQEDWKPGQASSDPQERVLVRLHGTFADAYNQDPKPVKGMYWRVPRSLVRPMGMPQLKLELSLVVFRWWDYWNQRNKRSRSHNVANEEMLLDVLQGPDSPHDAFGRQGAYEVYSAFVRGTSDLQNLGAQLAAAMRGSRRVALYFLWPTQRPAVERRLPACVSETAFFQLQSRMEEAGIRTCWPHDQRLYRELSGKLWVPRVCRDLPELHVPATVRVDMDSWLADPRTTAEAIISELQQLRGKAPETHRASPGLFRGVAKLGFSWMGEDVRPFSGPTELEKVLSQLLDGAPRDAVCLVQERVEEVVCELRMICFRDLASGPDAVKMELVRMKMHPPRHNDPTFSLTSHLTMTAAEARDSAFQGSAKAMQAAESEVHRLANRWLQWFRDEGLGTPASIRLDFLVSKARSGTEPRVWTVELCENGGSLCGLPHAARTTSFLNNCMEGVSDTSSAAGSFPKPLPSLVASASLSGNNGGNSSSRGLMAKNGSGLFGTLARLLTRWQTGGVLALLVVLLLRFSSRRRQLAALH